MKNNHRVLGFLLLLLACSPTKNDQNQTIATADMQDKLNKYQTVPLTADLSHLSANQQKMIPLLIQAADIMDELFWEEAYGKKDSLLNEVNQTTTREYININYGPWDRIEDNEPFIAGVGEKPLGANFYPTDMSKEEFEAAEIPQKNSQYTMIRRNGAGELMTIPYHEYFSEQVQKASDILQQAAELAEDEGFKKYLTLRANALLTDQYQESDLAWMDMKDNKIDVVIGPIETYEDQLFGYKAAHEAYILIKDLTWSDRLSHYAQFLPDLQDNLPVPDAYKQEEPGTDADLNAYDVIYYAGDCNAGSKTIAINLPNDEEVQLQKGTRRLQLKNAMQAKFDEIMIPIAAVLIDEDQRGHVQFDAFFANTMFHEVAHGLGIKNTINDQSPVRKALKEHASSIEEGKADILGLYMINQLYEKGELEGELMDYYVTFLAGIFRSVRFGSSSAHGIANMIRFNYYKEREAFVKNEETGTYLVDLAKMQDATNELAERILIIQGDGDYQAASDLVSKMGKIGPELQIDLDKLQEANIPEDIVFQQGLKILGLMNL